MMVDGVSISDTQDVVIRDRRMLAEDGMFVIIALIDQKTGKLKKSPDLISRGFVRINLSRFFFWTGLFLVVVAAGVFSHGLGDLQGAGILPDGRAAYDLRTAIPGDSWYGTLLGGLFQFTADPTWLQVIGWLAYTAVVLTLFLRVSLAKKTSAPALPTAEPATSEGVADANTPAATAATDRP